MSDKAGFLGLGTAGGVAAGGAVVAAVVGVLYATGTLSPSPDPEPEAVAVVQPAPAEPAPEAEPAAQVAEPDTEAETAEPEAQAEVVEPEATEPAATEPEATEPEATQPEVTQTEEPAVPPLNAPKFDVVRAAPDGTTVVAGASDPGSTVQVLVNGVVEDTQTADSRGAFASILLLPPSDQARVLTLLAILGDQQIASEAEIILAPTPAPVVAAAEPTPEPAPEPAPEPTGETQPVEDPQPEVVAVAEPEPEAEPTPATTPTPEVAATEEPAPSAQPVEEAEVAVAEPTDPAPATTTPIEEPAATPAEEPAATEAPATEVASAATEPTPDPVAEPTPEPAAEPQSERVDDPAPVAVLLSDADGVELVQPATPAPESAPSQISLDTIGYAPTGDVLLSGRGPADSLIRVYLDNTAVADIRSEASGRWRARLDGIDPGVYTLRLDALSDDGRVLSRVETPFKRESAEVLAEAQAEVEAPAEPAPINQVTVQTGDTLWAISRERYGDGLLYVRVFEANRSAIRDPDLIYPGQVFTIPE